MEKIVDKTLYKIVKQPLGGGNIELCGEYMDLHQVLTRAAHMSERNCGKHLVGGGFNPNHHRELTEVYGDDSK